MKQEVDSTSDIFELSSTHYGQLALMLADITPNPCLSVYYHHFSSVLFRHTNHYYATGVRNDNHNYELVISDLADSFEHNKTEGLEQRSVHKRTTCTHTKLKTRP